MQEKKTDRVDKVDIRYLKGVGPKKAGTLNKLGINTVEDILYYLPRRYEDRRYFTLVKDVKVGEYNTIKGKVLTSGVHTTKKGISIFQLALGDRTGVIYCVWFNQPFLKKTFKAGQKVIVYGKVERYDKLQINHPEYEFVKDEKASVNAGKIVPVYPLTEDVTQRYMRFLTHEAIGRFLNTVRESLPTKMIARNKLVDLRFAIHNIHFPVSFENLEKAYRRLVFEDFFILQVALAMKKRKVRSEPGGISHVAEAGLSETFKKLLPFEPTKAQLKAMDEIHKDMASPRPMNRLLEGDVGSGKTLVAIYAMLLAVRSGYQVAIMAPTEILARQHYINISELLMPLGINVSLLVSGLKEAKKASIKKNIEESVIDVVIGTHALILEDVSFKKLGLIVIDEQHKFGVDQRKTLKSKGLNPDVLIMTATPIPRTLAMTIYGDLDVSVIKEMPKGRYPVTTYCVSEENRQKVYDFMREEIEKGRQAYVVSPRIWSTKNRSEANNDLKAATHMYNKLQEEVFPDLRLGLLHGRMNLTEKEGIMRKFKNKSIDILIATTVIEVGIDIPNASIMVIENAERFGLSQLHQLRGRIGRGAYESYCILLGNPKTESAKKRFETMSSTQDGFKIAEEDLELRGPGEFLGTRQHGLPELRFGNILRDFDIMEEARREAFELIQEDPTLSNEKNLSIARALKKRFTDKLSSESGVKSSNRVS